MNKQMEDMLKQYVKRQLKNKGETIMNEGRKASEDFVESLKDIYKTIKKDTEEKVPDLSNIFGFGPEGKNIFKDMIEKGKETKEKADFDVIFNGFGDMFRPKTNFECAEEVTDESLILYIKIVSMVKSNLKMEVSDETNNISIKYTATDLPFSTGSFDEVIHIPEEYDISPETVMYKDGVLKIVFSKKAIKEPTVKPVTW